jgi:hypothetical protein
MTGDLDDQPPPGRLFEEPETVTDPAAERPFKDEAGVWHFPPSADPFAEPARPHARVSTEELWAKVAGDPRTGTDWSRLGILKLTVARDVQPFATELARPDRRGVKRFAPAQMRHLVAPIRVVRVDPDAVENVGGGAALPGSPIAGGPGLAPSYESCSELETDAEVLWTAPLIAHRRTRLRSLSPPSRTFPSVGGKERRPLLLQTTVKYRHSYS